MPIPMIAAHRYRALRFSEELRSFIAAAWRGGRRSPRSRLQEAGWASALDASRAVERLNGRSARRAETDTTKSDKAGRDRLFRVDALVNSGRPLVVSQIRLHPPRPRIACSCPIPGLALRNPGMFELVDGQIFRLAFDGDKPAGAEAARDRQIARDISCVVPGVELLLHRCGDVDPPHLEKRSQTLGAEVVVQ